MNKTTVAPQTKTASFLPPAQGLLQRKCACGNHTVAGGECAECAKNKKGLQRKLSIGASNDPLELEADRVADQVMAAHARSTVSSAPLRIQRFSGQANSEGEAAPASVDHVLSSSGRPLEPKLRQDMEQRFGYDFSGVQIHTDGAAQDSARDINANAYTVGQNIVFGSSQFTPGANDGRRLLAHELTHVVQQSSLKGFGYEQRNEKDKLSTAFESSSNTQLIQRQTAINTVGPQKASGPQSVEEFFLCLIICMCDEAPTIGILGQSLKQVCVDKLLSALDLAMKNLSPIKSEVSYDMTKAPPEPIMSSSNPLQKKSWIPDYIKRFIPQFKPGTGMIRRPDVVIVQNPNLAPTQSNIKKVIEIKFPGDALSQAQNDAYILIAGSASKLGVMTPESCQCEEMKKKLLEALEIIAEMLALAAVITALVADDATGIGAADDPLLIPALARMAILLERLTVFVPRVAPLFLRMALK